MRSRHPDIRTLLKTNPDGMTVAQIAAVLKALPGSVNKALTHMPDAYVDRWTDPVKGQYQAVWCVITPPENCPRP